MHSFNENKVDEGEPRMGSGYYDTLRSVRQDYVPESSDSEWDDEEEE